MSDETPPLIEVTSSAPTDAVWNALRDKDTIRQWFGWDYDGLDDEIDLIFFTDTVEDVSARTLSLHGADRFRLEPDGEGTRITLTRAPRGDHPELDAYYGEITEGWITFVQQLRFAVERHPGAARRTLSFLGGNPDSVNLVDALDLAHVAASEPFRTNLLGEDVSGDLWFRSEHQFGVTVDAWGDGLLIVSGTNPTPTKPAGNALAILSTYDLDDDRREQLESRWRSWWTEQFPGGN